MALAFMEWRIREVSHFTVVSKHLCTLQRALLGLSSTIVHQQRCYILCASTSATAAEQRGHGCVWLFRLPVITVHRSMCL